MSGRWRDAVEELLARAGTPARVTRMRPLAGGCIHQTSLAVLDDGRRVVIKCGNANDLAQFREEMRGLQALASTRTVQVPMPFDAAAQGELAVLMMSYIEPRGDCDERSAWRRLGEDLAALHLAPLAPELAHGYGFDIDNHLGSTPQLNGWHDDWVEFNAVNRFGPQVRMASDAGRLDGDDRRLMDSVVQRLDRILPRRPTPSLVHGDLWSGNIVPTRSPAGAASFAVIDPAPYVGEALVDLAMMTLFGGFDAECLAAWSDRSGVDHRGAEARERLAAYQLYHVLNHVNIFGRGYAGQAVALARRLI